MPGPETVSAVEALVNARDRAELEQVLRGNRELLLIDEADDVLASLIAANREDVEGLSWLRHCRSLVHRCREYGVERGLETPAPVPEEISVAVLELVNLRGQFELMRFIEQHLEVLVSPEATQMLDGMEVDYRDDPAIIEHLRRLRERLERCRREGVERAFSDDVMTFSQDLGEALMAFVQAPFDQTQTVVGRYRALLLTEDAERGLAFLASGATDSDQAAQFASRLALLRRLRAHGVDAVFDTAAMPGGVGEPSARTSPPEPELVEELLGELQRLGGAKAVVDQDALEDLLRRRPELSGAVSRAMADGLVLWTAGADRSPARAILREAGAAYDGGRWEELSSLGARALDLVSRDDEPEVWGLAHLLIATGLARTPTSARPELLERAIDHHLLAREGLTNDAGGARELNEHHLALAYQQRLRGRRAENIEQSIAILRALIDGAKDPDPAWELSLAESLGQRRLGAPAQSVSEAVELIEGVMRRAQERGDAHTEAPAAVLLGVTLMRSPAGDRSDNVERAVDLLKRSAPELDASADPISWVNAYNSLATAYLERARGDAEENWRAALDALAKISVAFPRETHPDLWAQNQMSLALLHTRHPGERGNTRAIAILESTLRVYTFGDHPDRWALVHYNLGSLCAASAEPGAVERAVGHLEQAFRVYTRERAPERWARIHVALGRLSLRRVEGLPMEEAWVGVQPALEHFERALETATVAADPSYRLEILETVATVQFRFGRWRDALRIFTEAMRVADQLLASAHTEPGRLASTSASSAIHDPAAYCLYCGNDLFASLVCAEWGKGRLLAQALALRDLDLVAAPPAELERLRGLRSTVRALEAAMRAADPDPGSSRRLAAVRLELEEALPSRGERTRRIGIDQIFDTAPAPGALLLPVITAEGSVVFAVIKHADGEKQLTHMPAPWLTTGAMRGLVNGTADHPGWVPRYRRWREGIAPGEEWRASLRETLAALWSALMEPIAELLADRLPEHAPVVIVPPGSLSFLPWHAASEDGSGAGALLERFAVSYAPSVFALRASLRRAAALAGAPDNLLVIVNPTEDLDFADVEGEELRARTGTLLPHSQATLGAVSSACGGRSHIHFACHAFHDAIDSARSGLQLADGTLTLGAILAPEVDLSAARLVTLSACETGLIDSRYAPDEFIGLPTAFLQGGACAVISTAWPVNDRATSLLMHRFYDLHLGARLPPAAALRDAQLWLRDQAGYDDPYFWAPFQLTGA